MLFEGGKVYEEICKVIFFYSEVWLLLLSVFYFKSGFLEYFSVKVVLEVL